jgi:uncharacterized protein involved in exopolysaccharide biosynthesis
VQLLSDRAFVEAAVDRFGPDAFKTQLVPPTSVYGYPKYWAKSAARRVKGIYKEFLIAANIKKRLTPREEAILGVMDGLDVEPIKESDVLVLKLRLPSAQLAAGVAKVIVDSYMEHRGEVRRAPAGRSYFETRVADYRNRLDELAQKRAALRKEWNLSEPTQQRTLLLQRLSTLNTESTEVQAQEVQLNSQLSALISQVGSLPGLVAKEQTVARNPTIASVNERIASLLVDRAKVASRYTPDSESVRNIDREIADLQTVLKQQGPTVLASVTQQANPSATDMRKDIERIKAQIQGLQERARELRQPAVEIQASLHRLDTGADELERLAQDYQVTESEYLDYQKRLEEARMSDELDSRRLTNVTIFAGPDLPIEPVSPRKLFIMGIALPVWLLLGLVMAAVMESMEDRLRTPEDWTALQIPWLGELDAINEKSYAEPRDRNGSNGKETSSRLGSV